MGGYGFIRFSLPMFPHASEFFAPLIFALSIIAVIYTSLVALAQSDMKKLIAYSSVAHMGFVTIGIFTMTEQGIAGAMFQMTRPEHLVGSVQECFYDPEWNTRTNLLPSGQVAFLSEMGYSAWKWILLLLFLVPLLMMCATCGYACFLGVEKVVASQTVLL